MEDGELTLTTPKRSNGRGPGRPKVVTDTTAPLAASKPMVLKKRLQHIFKTVYEYEVGMTVVSVL